MKTEDYFQALDKAGMQRKFDKNVVAAGGDIAKFRDSLARELEVYERKLLEVKHNVLLPLDIQCQNLRDQLQFVDEALALDRNKKLEDRIIELETKLSELTKPKEG